MGLIVLLMIVIAMKIAKPKELYKAVDYNLALVIALSLALGTAMIKSGAADLVADVITRLFIPIGKVGLLFGIYFITAFLAAYITNKAAVAIVFPISIMLAANLSLNPIPFVLVVSFAAAANFMTPHGYQTNLMVYGPGGYTFGNFFKIGFPLTMIYMVVTVIILRLVYL
jgi:di/tricarboxylate transporter